MGYQLAIFDFDGTVADTFPWISELVSFLAKEHNMEPPTSAQLEEFRALGTQHILKKYHFPLWKIPAIARQVQEKMSEEIDKIVLFENMEIVLQQLSQQGIQLAMVSSNELGNIQKVLGQELSALFSFFECGVSMFSKQVKFKKILTASGVHGEKALCIGDEIRDIEAARKANIPFGAVSWGYTNIETLKAFLPQEVFHSVEDITKAFLR